MKRPKWSARALYIAVALALVIGLMPIGLAPMAVIADTDPSISISGPVAAVQGQQIQLVATTDPDIGDVDWYVEPDDTNIAFTGPVWDTNFEQLGTVTVRAVGSWHNGEIVRYATHDIEIGWGLEPYEDYNIIGSSARFDVPYAYQGLVDFWSFFPSFELGGGWDVIDGGDENDTFAVVQAWNQGELVIMVHLTEGGPLIAHKKWGKIYDTVLQWKDYEDQLQYGPGSSVLKWDNHSQDWIGSVTLCDHVYGQFVTNGRIVWEELADGAHLQWWVLHGDAPVHQLPESALASELIPAIRAMQAAWPSRHVGFESCGTKTLGDPLAQQPPVLTVDGEVCVELVACGPERVKIVLVAKYPYAGHYDQWHVFPQILSWEFTKPQLEKVPKVAWAGEKVVLEKNFGSYYAGADVLFALEGPVLGALVPLYGEDFDSFPLGAQQVWTEADSDGVARVIIESETPGEAHIKCSLYKERNEHNNSSGGGSGRMTQHGFVVYFLALEDVKLTNVQGERTDHDEGRFEYPDGSTNPWNPEHPDFPDTISDELNVSQDTLLRARVRGWFEHNVFNSGRPALTVLVDGHPYPIEIAPADRFVLPDDWHLLANGPTGYSRWAEMAPHWDIMTQPNDNIMAVDPLGPYIWRPDGVTVAQAPVIGPYSSLDDYTSSLRDPLDRKTIVPNAKLNWWDCPMPPAKIGFQIMDGPGFFKEADKADVYYTMVNDQILYTNPFYETMIPASPFIPWSIDNGGYDWNSYNPNYGPYPFWEFINTTPRSNKELTTGFVEIHNHPQHPTWVWVYSDNHGEAMVYLNGDWNLDLAVYSGADEGPHDIPTDTEVGTTTVEAIAKYPYLRDLGIAVSDPVDKTWEWGVDIRGNDRHQYWDGTWDDQAPPDPDLTRMVIQVREIDAGTGLSNYKMAFIWVADRDGMPVVGAEIEWTVATQSGTEATIPNFTGSPSIQDIGHPLRALSATNGFLTGTNGSTSHGRTRGVSYTRMPTDAEVYMWNKRYGIDVPRNHAVAAVMVYASVPPPIVNLSAVIHLPREGNISRHWVLDFLYADPKNPCPYVFPLGDLNQDRAVDHKDVLIIQRVIHGLETCPIIVAAADLTGDGKVNIRDIYMAISIWDPN